MGRCIGNVIGGGRCKVEVKGKYCWRHEQKGGNITKKKLKDEKGKIIEYYIVGKRVNEGLPRMDSYRGYYQEYLIEKLDWAFKNDSNAKEMEMFGILFEPNKYFIKFGLYNNKVKKKYGKFPAEIIFGRGLGEINEKGDINIEKMKSYV
jgi:hypothetical protein